MTVSSKIAVSLPSDLVTHARRAVEEGRAKSVSAYVAAALTEKAKMDDLAALLDEMLEGTGGPLTAAEKRAADGILGVPTPRKRAPRRVGRTA